MLVTEYFKDYELDCTCGCGLKSPQKAVERLYAARVIWGRPMYITSAIRCPFRNTVVDGAVGSIHLPPEKRIGRTSEWGGGAFDIACEKEDQDELIRILVFCGFRGIGRGSNFVHCDDADRTSFNMTNDGFPYMEWTY